MKYKRTAFILALVFCIYNVGIPVVISACPMIANNKAKLACCADVSSGGLKIKSSKDTSCCKFAIVAKPNKTEYLKVKFDFELSNYFSFSFFQVLIDFSNSNSLYFVSSFTSSSSPPVTDIPVFTSSLLI
ncbi:MAG: hypothetical protein HY960_09145 [Ignavibacteriae bacterium]|nr:hypothetical protein [Ignavibacteriota bacterium]